jgi:hypothetical protein
MQTIGEAELILNPHNINLNWIGKCMKSTQLTNISALNTNI